MDKNKGKKMLGIVGIAVLLIVFIVGVPISWDSSYAAEKNEIIIASILPFTGTNAQWGTRNDRGIRMMIDKINAWGGIKSMGGAKIKYITADTESKPDVAQSQAEKIAAQHAVAVFGTNQSSSTITVTQVLERKEIPLICTSDIDPLITSRGFKYIFRTTTIMRDMANMVLIYAQEMNKTHNTNFVKVGVLCENSIVGDSAAKALAKYTKKIGYTLIDVVKYDAATTKDFTGVLSRFKAKGVELLVGHNKPADSIQIVRNCKEIEFNPAMLGGVGGGYLTPDFSANLGSLTENIIVSAVEAPEATVGKFSTLRDEYNKLYNEDMATTAIGGVSGVWVLYDALERCGSKDPKVLAEAIRKTDLQYGEGYYLQQFGCKFDENGDNVRAGASIHQFRGGKRPSVFPAEVAKAKSVWPKPKFK